MDKNRYIHEKLYPEKCWHEWRYVSAYTLCDSSPDEQCIKCDEWKSFDPNPDYSSDEWLPKLIKRLVELELFDGFMKSSLLSFGILAKGEPVHVENVCTDIIWAFQQPRFSNLLLGYWGWEGELYK